MALNHTVVGTGLLMSSAPSLLTKRHHLIDCMVGVDAAFGPFVDPRSSTYHGIPLLNKIKVDLTVHARKN